MKKKPARSSGSDIAPAVAALDWAVAHGLASHVAGASLARARRRRRNYRAAAGAAIACLGVLAFVPWPAAPSPGSIPAAHFAASPARQVLPDGTIVDLKKGAAIVSHMAPAADGGDRRVTLTRGEAHFEVAHDPSRPFIVSAGALSVRALGTAFAVDFGPRSVEVVVSEGRVAVERPPPPASGAVPSRALASEVRAGERILVPVASRIAAKDPRVETLAAAALAERLAWRVPRLEFSGTPLSEAIPIFNRYGSVELVLSDPELGRLQLSGVLRPDNTASLLHLLRVEFGLEAEPRGAGEIILRQVPLPRTYVER